MFKKTLYILFLTLTSVNFSVVAEETPDIRFRNIIYFYPEFTDVGVTVQKNAFKDFTFVDELPKSANKLLFSTSQTREIKSLYPVPDINYLSYFGYGLDNEHATRIQDAKLAVVIDIAYPVEMTFEGLKLATTAIYDYANSVGGLIWDSETRELYTPDAWKEKRIDSWSLPLPEIERHTVIHAYENGEGVRAITLGMAKFGLPDIVVNDFGWSLNRSMGNLINIVAQSLAEGLLPNDEDMFILNIDKLQDTPFKKAMQAELAENAQSTVTIGLGEGKWEEGDPYNFLIELRFNHLKGSSLSEKQETLLDNLFGWEDKITYVQHNSQINEASEKARAKLNSLKSDFNQGLDPGEFILLKAPFETPEGGNEWMWVEVMSWEGKVVKGLLKNEPYHIPDLKAGSQVEVSQDDIFDYIRNFPDGTSEGNETGELIMKYQNQ